MNCFYPKGSFPSKNFSCPGGSARSPAPIIGRERNIHQGKVSGDGEGGESGDEERKKVN